MKPHRLRRIVFLWNNYAIRLRRTIDCGDETAHGASTSISPRLLAGGKRIDAFPRPLQSELHESTTVVICHRPEVERPDDTFNKNLRVSPTVQRYVRRLAQFG